MTRKTTNIDELNSRTPLAVRARSSTHGGGCEESTSASSVPGSFLAALGANRAITPRSTVPMSATVNRTVFLSRSKMARWTSLTADRSRLWKALLSTTVDAAPSTTGRMPTRSGCAFSTWSVIRRETSSRTAGRSSAELTWFENWSESKKTLLA